MGITCITGETAQQEDFRLSVESTTTSSAPHPLMRALREP